MKLSPRNWDFAFKQEVLSAKNVSDFLGRFVGPPLENDDGNLPNRPKKIGYADFSRRAEFSSRAFIRDVLQGTKKMSRGSAEKIPTALGLTGLWKRYFLALYESETPSAKNTQTLSHLRSQLLKSNPVRQTYGASSGPAERDRVKKLLALHVPAVFAACGSEAVGATEAEIISRTKLSSLKITRALETLVELELVREAEGRYVPQLLHLAYEKLGSIELFRQDFEATARNAIHRIKTEPDAKDALYFSSNFSVRSSDLPALVVRMRGLLEEFVNQSETAEGDRVAELVLGLGPFTPTQLKHE